MLFPCENPLAFACILETKSFFTAFHKNTGAIYKFYQKIVNKEAPIPVLTLVRKKCSNREFHLFYFLPHLENIFSSFFCLGATALLRSSRSQMFFKISVLKNFAIFTGEHLCWRLTPENACTFIKKRLQHWCFPVNIVKFLRITFL